MSDHRSLLKIITKDFDISEEVSEAHLRDVLIKTFEYLIEDDFAKLLRILYKADVDQDQLKLRLENAEGQSSAEVIASAYIERQQAKVATWKKYSSG
jgi:uncharacterized protein involved in tellurium resistance